MLANIHALGHAAGQSVRTLLLNHSSPVIPTPLEIIDAIRSFPSAYRKWWFDLLTSDPIHVFIETSLILTVVYVILSQRKRDWRTTLKEKLTEEEKEALLREWKETGRGGLVPPGVVDETRSDGEVVVVKSDGARMVVRRGRDPKGEEREVLNFATHDFLGMSRLDGSFPGGGGPSSETSKSDESSDETAGNGKNPIKEASRKALSTYGCGSCGPRGFYGTIDEHLSLEDDIAAFAQTDGAIMYSDGASAATSTVAAFAKRGDLLVVDEGIYEALGTGVTLSRATVKWFRHNDMDDLRRVLERVKSTDDALKRKSSDQRRFIVVEGLYKHYGTIAPLSDLAALKHEFNYRLIVDESFSFGTLGSTGRGALELHNLRRMKDAEIVILSLENALGSVGGVTVGNEEVVDHQRLSGAGYCFSASAPPFVASAARTSLARMRDDPALLEALRENRSYLYVKLAGKGGRGLDSVVPEKLVVTSDALSAIVFLQIADCQGSGESNGRASMREEQIDVLDAIAEECLRNGLALVSTGRHVGGHLHKVPPPSLRMAVSAAHRREDIDKALEVLRSAVLKVLRQ